jgi:hypothetical protein
MEKVIGGWNLGGITSFQTGLPVGLTTNSPTTLESTFGAGAARPNVVPGMSKKVAGSKVQRINGWFNTAAFTAPDTYGFDNESRLDSVLRSDGIDNFDMSLGKNMVLHEVIVLQFRAEMFNLFNHPQFAPPNGALGNAGFGRVTAQANQPRVGQFSLRLNY